MKMNVTETVKQACGHWPRILPALGVKVIKNRHQSCPVCGGSDRFRFDDKEGRGTWFCNQCGAGNGYRNVLSLKMFGLGLPMMLKEYGLNYEKRHTKQGIQTNLSLKEESYGDWLPKCDEPAAT